MKIDFILTTEKNLKEVLDLRVADNQSGFIETTAECLEEAKEFSLWRPVGIYIDNVLIGFAMYGLWEYEGDYGSVWLDRFLIDKRFQGKGYATPVLHALIDKITLEYNYDELYLSIYETNKLAIKLYQKLGFVFNGEKDINGEDVMYLSRTLNESKSSNK